MPIRTKSIYEKIGEEDGLRVLITRFYPRGISKSHFDCWLRELSPSKGLLAAYREGKVTWDEFRERLVVEVQNTKSSFNAIAFLASNSRTQNVTLLCYEKPGSHCHRYIIRDAIIDATLHMRGDNGMLESNLERF